MKIYKLNLDVDNYQGCFINETNLTKRDFKGLEIRFQAFLVHTFAQTN